MASRRTSRMRKEYLYRKSLEGKEKASYERKVKIREAMAAGKSIPTESRAEASQLLREIELEDETTAAPRSHLDDEYAMAGAVDPKVCITTSRDPSSRLKRFAKEMGIVIPNATRLNRGTTTTGELVDAARRADFTDIVLLAETRGEPDALTICHLPYGPTARFTLNNTVLRADLPETAGGMPAEYPHLIMAGFTTALGRRVASILKFIFPVPKPEAKRVLTFANDNDFVSFRHHTYTTAAGADAAAEGGSAHTGPRKGEVVLTEVGPRFELRPFNITLGTLEQRTADVEWALRPFMNTARKRSAMGTIAAPEE